MIKVEDGRDGGNPEFDGDVQDQYQDEVNAFRIIYLCKFDQIPSDLIILICFNEKGFPYDASAPLEHVSGGG